MYTTKNGRLIFLSRHHVSNHNDSHQSSIFKFIIKVYEVNSRITLKQIMLVFIFDHGTKGKKSGHICILLEIYSLELITYVDYFSYSSTFH